MRVQLTPDFERTAEAQTAAGIVRKCVHCGFCNATCPTYRLDGDELDGPRGRIYLIKQMLEGSESSRRTQMHLDRCLTCLNCETTCPSGVEYGQLVEIGRRLTDARVARAPFDRLRRALLREGLTSRWFGAAVGFARHLRPCLPQALRRRLPAAAPRARAASGTRPAAAAGSASRCVLLLGGCVQPSLLPNVGRSTVRVLAAAGVEARIAPAAGCCGALRRHLSDHAGSLEDMRRNVDAWWPALASGEVAAIVADASACALAVKDYGHALAGDPAYAARAAAVAAAARDLGELLPELVPRLRPLRGARACGPIAFHSPCTLQHGQRLAGAVETGLRALGFDLRPPPRDANLCCGSAGAYSLLEPRIATALRDAKLRALEETGAPTIASANVGCIGHRGAGTTRPGRHWIEILDEALAGESAGD